jgi:hypothetical protein
MSLTFSLLFVAFVVIVSVKLWRVLDKVENHLDKLDSFLDRQGNASPESAGPLQKPFAPRRGL